MTWPSPTHRNRRPPELPSRSWRRIRIPTHWLAAAAAIALLLGCASGAAAGQLGAIVAPGPLSKAHAPLEAVGSCVKCHDGGPAQAAARCLACHKPIAERIARKSGVHRAVTNTCLPCHAEHRGADADLRRIDERAFDHATETGLLLDGAHAALAAKCASCHKTRSFLEARAACSSCHVDPHRTTLGSDCARCHSPRTPFKETRTTFDHSRAAFTLTGAHKAVTCEKCHAQGAFSNLRFDTCSACHQEPHRNALGPSCTTCHTTDQWTTRTIDHVKTGFALVGAHAQVACAKCHQAGITKPLKADRCVACHTNVHRQSVKEDCRACHTERSFRGAAFDHAARTPYALVGRHDGLACRKCHTGISAETVPLARKVIDFGGLKTVCSGCHQDKHKGDFGRQCDSCHRPTTFNVSAFTHPRSPQFFAGQHTKATCVHCHVRPPLNLKRAGAPPPANPPSMECRACHDDVHLGQVGVTCERCHAVEAPRFAIPRFTHERTAFPLTGEHLETDCAKCHPTETRAFPAGHGTARRLNPMPDSCKDCHKDPHLGQLDAPCKTCHTTAAFEVAKYGHPSLPRTFAGLHGRLVCQACHKSETGMFPAGAGTAVRFKIDRKRCVDCHPQFFSAQQGLDF